MKGLFVKDFLAYKKIILKPTIFMLIISILVGFSFRSVAFTFMYFLFMILNANASLIVTDETSEAEVFNFTLPFSKKEYVIEKYLWLFCIIFGLGIIITPIAGVVDNQLFIKHISIMDGMTSFTSCLAAMFGFLIYESIAIPLYIKFGAKKGPLVSIITMGIITVIAFGVIAIIIASRKIPIKDFIQNLMQMNKAVALSIFGIVSILIYIGSACCSYKVLVDKTF